MLGDADSGTEIIDTGDEEDVKAERVNGDELGSISSPAEGPTDSAIVTKNTSSSSGSSSSKPTSVEIPAQGVESIGEVSKIPPEAPSSSPESFAGTKGESTDEPEGAIESKPDPRLPGAVKPTPCPAEFGGLAESNGAYSVTESV